MRSKRNDDERKDWVNNDEGLYSWWKRSRKGLTVFVRENHKEIYQAIDNMTEGHKPAHYLRYGG